MQLRARRFSAWIDLGLGSVGLIAAIIGWHFDHVEHFEWIQRAVAPRYFAASQLYDRMFTSHNPTHRGDQGFEEIASLVRPNLQGEGDITIDSLQITADHLSFVSRPTGMSSEPTISLTVILADGRFTSSSDVSDLRPSIRERFLQSQVFNWGSGIFWTGIGLSALALSHSWYRAGKKLHSAP